MLFTAFPATKMMREIKKVTTSERKPRDLQFRGPLRGNVFGRAVERLRFICPRDSALSFLTIGAPEGGAGTDTCLRVTIVVPQRLQSSPAR